jgi:glutathione S-transferase
VRTRAIAYLRDQLASVGIDLLVAPAATQPVPTTNSPGAPFDRERVREILVANGARAADLEWLVASCPSVADAAAYRPPARTWCAHYDRVLPLDAGGRRVPEGRGAEHRIHLRHR